MHDHYKHHLFIIINNIENGGGGGGVAKLNSVSKIGGNLLCVSTALSKIVVAIIK